MLLIFAHEFLINWDLFIFDQCKNQWTGWWSDCNGVCFLGFCFFLQIAAYEREIGTLQAQLMKEIEHLEEKKDEAVKAAANCSQEQFQSLQDQFMSESALILDYIIPELCMLTLFVLISIPCFSSTATSECSPSHPTLDEDRLCQSAQSGPQFCRLLWISHQRSQETGKQKWYLWSNHQTWFSYINKWISIFFW